MLLLGRRACGLFGWATFLALAFSLCCSVAFAWADTPNAFVEDQGNGVAKEVQTSGAEIGLVGDIPDELEGEKGSDGVSSDMRAGGQKSAVEEASSKTGESAEKPNEPAIGWIEKGGSKFYTLSSGAMATGWQRIDGSWYYFSASGAMLSSRWVDGRYWLGGDGKMAESSWVDGGRWFVGAGGAWATGWVNDGADWFWALPSGGRSYGWLLWKGSWYWLDRSTGAMATGWREVGGVDYFFSSSGAMAALSWVSLGGDRYRFVDVSGAAGIIACKIDSGMRVEDASPGWLTSGSEKFYAENDLALARGWKTIGGSRYYFDVSTYLMRTGWFFGGSAWYYLNDNGKMATGWKKVNGYWYYLASDGVMQTGWIKDGSTWYYLYSDGHMAANTWIDGYYVNSSGAWVSDTMASKAQSYSSKTSYLILVDRSAHQVGVFSGRAGNWTGIQRWSCVTGAPSTPTITGTYSTTGGRRMSLDTDSRARYCTQIWGGYFFHTILASENELGKSLSHGCIRLPYSAAQWIYNNVRVGTTVVIYN